MRIVPKICGLTNERDVDLAVELGAEYFGFIVYPGSPRCLTVKRAKDLAKRVPEGRSVAVDVMPSSEKTGELASSGFGNYQIHSDLDHIDQLGLWSDAFVRERLWLAPRLRAGESPPREFLDGACTILIDTYSSAQIGGTGKTGDWSHFAKLKQSHPEIRWILAGGLNAGNLPLALARSGADHVDLSSGVEASPGVKDPEKLRAVLTLLKGG